MKLSVLLSASLLLTVLSLSPPAAMADDNFYNQGTTMLMQQKYQQAIPFFDVAIGKGTKFIAAYINRGVCYSKLGYYQKAIDDFSAALKVDPTDSTALTNRGGTYYKMGKPQEALKDLNKAADSLYKQKKVSVAKIYLERAAINHDVKHFSEAIADCKRVAAIPQAPADVRQNADSLMKWCQVGMQKEVLIGMSKALDSIRAKDYVTADKELNRVSEYEQNSARILALQSVVATLQKDYPVAEAKAKAAIKANPKDGKSYVALADILLIKGRYDEATANLTKATELGVRSAEIYELRGIAYLLDGRLEKATTDFNEILRLRPADSRITLLRGACSIVNRDANQLITDGKSVMDKEGVETEKGAQGALLAYDGLLRAERADEASKLLETCLEKAPKDKWPYAIFQFLKKDIDGEALMKSAGDSKEQKTDAHAWIGLVAMKSGDNDKANAELAWIREDGDVKQLSYVLLAAGLVKPRIETPVTGNSESTQRLALTTFGGRGGIVVQISRTKQGVAS